MIYKVIYVVKSMVKVLGISFHKKLPCIVIPWAMSDMEYNALSLRAKSEVEGSLYHHVGITINIMFFPIRQPFEQ